ncbi:hypothetical protein QT327_16535 [Olivibacter sp. 47]|jgi:hypothetical protein|uniref:hypothetical protein n=1 Tax=Olivibacter sp. 47 TaxID=3056486 RepID=UPI0025A38CE0|nr:hypothetical protein [Olivibacter sp. 47]MDM8175935.1 hypothetical protein [Olivibacter sp. 47]
MKKKNLIPGEEIVRLILALQTWDEEAVMEDLDYAGVATKSYVRTEVRIEELRRQDIHLHTFIDDRYDIGPLLTEIPPILIGRRYTHGPYSENLVVDGFYRVAAAYAAGLKTIEAYVPETGTVYIT